MNEMIRPTMLWAMHPDYLAALLKRASMDAMVPEPLRALGTALGGGNQARPASDPIREGATVIIPVDGPLTPKGSWQGTSTIALADRVRDFAADAKVGALILKISSPGGLVWGTRECGDAIFEARQSKPVVAIADPYSFSAAHWLGCQASAYYASHSADVGSVGVRGGHVDMSGFEDKIGMKTTLIASHPDKICAHPYAPLSDEDRKVLQDEIDEADEEFVAAIARGRGIKPALVHDIHGNGLIFSAKRAAAAGITDGIMSLRDAVAKYGSGKARLDLMRRQMALLEQTISI